MSERKEHFVSLQLCHPDTLTYIVRCIITHDYLTDHAKAMVMPSMSPEEACYFVRMIDAKAYHIAVNDERMPKRAAHFKVENFHLKECREWTSAYR